MSAGFTPGPWSVRVDRTIADANGVPLMRGYAERNFEANGPLAAAAPELYKYLAVALGVINAAGIVWLGSEDASTALAKARGEA